MTTAALETLYQASSPGRMQQQAWEKWKELGFPSRKQEAFRYVSLKKLQEVPAFFPQVPRFDCPSLRGMVVLPLKEAKLTYGPLLEKQVIERFAKGVDPFYCLNQALDDTGLFIYVPPHVSIEAPFKLTQCMTVNEKMPLYQPKIEIVLGKGAELKTFFSKEQGTHPFWNNAVMHVTLEEGAHYHHYDLAGKHKNSWDFLSFHADLKASSSLKFFTFGLGGAVQRRDLAVRLQGENAAAELLGLTLLDQANEGHIHIRVDHEVPHARSDQFFKHVLKERARSSFEGKIFVNKKAQQTEAYQLNNNLILSDHAAAFCKPNLEIYADDVKASHGATVAKPRPDELFYLSSRGLSQEDAVHHLASGFCREILKRVPLVADRLNGEIDAYLS